MSLQNNGTNRLLAQPARILKENTLINDENRAPTENNDVSRFGRNQKKREVLGELGCSVGNELNVYLDKSVPVAQQRKRPLRNAKVCMTCICCTTPAFVAPKSYKFNNRDHCLLLFFHSVLKMLVAVLKRCLVLGFLILFLRQ